MPPYRPPDEIILHWGPYNTDHAVFAAPYKHKVSIEHPVSGYITTNYVLPLPVPSHALADALNDEQLRDLWQALKKSTWACWNYDRPEMRDMIRETMGEIELVLGGAPFDKWELRTGY